MKEEKRLARNTAILAVGKMCTQFISFLLLPLYTALLTTEEYGTVDLLVNYVTLLTPIVTLQLENALFRYLVEHRRETDKQDAIITTAFVCAAWLAVLFAVVMIVVGHFISSTYLGYLSVYTIVNAFSALLLQTARGLDDYMGYAMGSFFCAASTVGLNVLFIVGLQWGGVGMIRATILGSLICVVFLAIREKILYYIKPQFFSCAELKKMLQYSIPLLPNALSWWIMSASDRSVISFFLGVSWNGIYSTASKFSSIVINIYNIYNLSWTESVVLNYDKPNRQNFFQHMIEVAFRLFSCACVGVVAIMPFVFPIMINDAYGASYGLIPILMLNALCTVVVGLYSTIYVAEKRTKEIAKTSILSAGINLAVDLALVNFIGVYAAPAAGLAASSVMMIWRYSDTQKYISLHISRQAIVGTILTAAIVGGAYYLRNSLICAVVLLLYLIYCIVINREILQVGFDLVKTKLVHKNGGYEP